MACCLAAIVTRSASKPKAMSPETAPGSGAQRPKTRGMIAKSPKKTFQHDKSHGLTPPDVRGQERNRAQAVLRTSKFWEKEHPGIPGKNKATAVVVEEYA